MKFFYLILYILTACSHGNHARSPIMTGQLDALKESYDGWLKELAATADKATGWPSATDCDGTLWAGEAVAAGHPAQLVLAEHVAGEVHRRPRESGECYPKESKSTVSPDMLVGYNLGMVALKDKDALERLQKATYAKALKVGEPDVYWSPAGYGLLSRSVKFLGGADSPATKAGDPCGPVFDDYQFHIRTLGVLLDNEVSGGISDNCLKSLQVNAEKFPSDALIQAAWGVFSGDLTRAIELLLSPDYACPSYVRGAPTYCTVHKVYAASVVIKRFAPQSVD